MSLSVTRVKSAGKTGAPGGRAGTTPAHLRSRSTGAALLVTTRTTTTRRQPLRWYWDIAGAATVVLAAAATLYPALSKGFVSGSLDIMNIWPVTHGLFMNVHTKASFDQASQMSPWLAYDWHSIHSGTFPLWNRYTLLGMPQFGNFQSGVLSLPHLVSYLFAQRYAYTISTLVTLLIGGSGAYTAARVIGADPVLAAVGGVAFELSGSFANWAGWPQGAVNAWIGWLVALAILIYRRERSPFLVVSFAVVVAFAIYAGHPESYLFVAATVLLVCLIGAIVLAVTGKSPSGRPVRAILRLLAGTLLGALLGAPLLLAGFQLLPMSTRVSLGFAPSYAGLPPSTSVMLLVPGFYGMPVQSSNWTGPLYSIYEIGAAVGAVIVALALYALLRLWRRPLVMGMGAVALLQFLVIYDFGPLQHLLGIDSVTRMVGFSRLLMPLDFLLVMLAVLGLRHIGEQARHEIRIWRADVAMLWAAVVAVGLLLGGIALALSGDHGISPSVRGIRLHATLHALEGYGAAAIPLLAIAVALSHSERRPGSLRGSPAAQARSSVPVISRLMMPIAVVILIAEAGLLVPPVAQMTSFGRQYYPVDRNVSMVRNAVGSAILGAGAPLPLLGNASGPLNVSQQGSAVRAPGAADLEKDVSSMGPFTGFLPESNIAYGVPLMSARDPMLPKAYLQSWAKITGIPEGVVAPSTVAGPDNIFTPTFLTPAMARYYGVSYLFVAGVASASGAGMSVGGKQVCRPAAGGVQGAGAAAPAGSDAGQAARFAYTGPQLAPGLKVAACGDGFLLVKVLGSGQFTVQGDKGRGASDGSVSAVSWAGDNSVSMQAHSAEGGTLVARLTALPGWTVTVDGHGEALSTLNGLMLALDVPAGTSRVTLTYSPAAFTYGVYLAFAGGVIIVLVAVAVLLRRRRRPSTCAHTPGARYYPATLAPGPAGGMPAGPSH